MPCQIKRSTGARRYNAPSRLPLGAALLPGGCPYCPDHPTHPSLRQQIRLPLGAGNVRPNGSTPFGWPLTPSPWICLKGRQGFGSVYGGLWAVTGSMKCSWDG